MQRKIYLLAGLLISFQLLHAQGMDSTSSALARLQSGRYLDKVSGQSALLDKQLTTQSEKYLQGVAAEEEKLKTKLQKIDPATANTLFGNVAERYQKLQAEFLQSGSGAVKSTPGQYIPSIDSLKNTLLFLQTSKNPLSNISSTDAPKLASTLGQVQGLENKINAADNLKTWMDQRKQYLSEQLGKYNMTKELGKMNEKIYYYKQQVNGIKSSLNDPSKIKQQAVNLLSKLPAYNKFLQQHSYLSSLFGQPESYNLSDSSMKGLQSRAVVQKMIQDKISTGGPNAGQQVAQQAQLGSSVMSQLKSKLTGLGSKDDPQDPGFKPNSQKTKSLWKRLEYGADLQFEPSGNLLPTICDLALTLGYRLNDNGTIGIGAAYKMGLGDGLQHIRFSSEGLGLRSYVDWKLKKNIYLSGGYEQNYLSEFQSIGQLRIPSAWQQSGLIGLSRKYQISNRVKGKLQLLFDFLSYNQVPKTPPIMFRTGWTF